MPCPHFYGNDKATFKERLTETLKDLRVFLLTQHFSELDVLLRENQLLRQQIGNFKNASNLSSPAREAPSYGATISNQASEPTSSSYLKITRFDAKPEAEVYVSDEPATEYDFATDTDDRDSGSLTKARGYISPLAVIRGSNAAKRSTIPNLRRGDSNISRVSVSHSLHSHVTSIQRSTLGPYASDGRSGLDYVDDYLTDLAESSYRRSIGAFFWIRNIWGAFIEFGYHESNLIELARLSDPTSDRDSNDENVAITMAVSEAGLLRKATSGLSSALSPHDSGHLQSCHCDFMRRFLIRPTSRIRIMWILTSFAFLIYDFFVLPVDAVFSDGDSSNEFADVTQFLARTFWTVDILVSFLSGYYKDGFLIMEPARVAWEYIKSWFLFDVSLVGLEWFLMIVETTNETATVSMFRGARWSRIARLMRLVRFARFVKLRSMAMDLFAMTSDAVMALVTVLKTVVLLISFAHLGACVWALIGNVDDGWVDYNDMSGDTTFRKYSIALHWLLISLQGSRIPFITVRRTSEIFIDSILLFTSLILQALLISTVTQAVLSKDNHDMVAVRRNAHKYLKTNRISAHTAIRTRRFLQTSIGDGPSEMLSFEQKLFKVLPRQLQEDLNYELRHKNFCKVSGFDILHYLTPRIMRHLCNEMVNKLVIADESVFSKGDACNSLHMVRAGLFHYSCKEATLTVTPRYAAFPRCKGPKSTDILQIGQCVSEAALWTEWENVGDLKAKDNDGILTVLDADTLAAVTVQYKVGRAHAVKYSQHFVWRLNRCAWCDVTGFDFSLSELEEPLFEGSDEKHFIFLSHYKVEAGTEATLMRDIMLKSIRDDPMHEGNDLMIPVFIDSEDLVDLAKLSTHAKGSRNLVVLLTPGVLARPWCLLEIVIAARSDCRLVPVEVQRPGMNYEYPDDDWYADLRNGQILQEVDVAMLQREGILLEEVEDAIRKMFTTIALPFSPHKSENVRTAELEDIMKRCRGGSSHNRLTFKSTSKSSAISKLARTSGCES